MSNAVYPSALDAFLSGDIDYLTETINVALLTGDYAFDADHDTFDPLVFGDATVATAALSDKSVVAGEAFADPVQFPSVEAGDTVTSLVVYSADSDRLICFVDTGGDTTLISIVTNDGDINVTWPDNRIFKI